MSLRAGTFRGWPLVCVLVLGFAMTRCGQKRETHSVEHGPKATDDVAFFDVNRSAPTSSQPDPSVDAAATESSNSDIVANSTSAETVERPLEIDLVRGAPELPIALRSASANAGQGSSRGPIAWTVRKPGLLELLVVIEGRVYLHESVAISATRILSVATHNGKLVALVRDQDARLVSGEFVGGRLLPWPTPTDSDLDRQAKVHRCQPDDDSLCAFGGGPFRVEEPTLRVSSDGVWLEKWYREDLTSRTSHIQAARLRKADGSEAELTVVERKVTSKTHSLTFGSAATPTGFVLAVHSLSDDDDCVSYVSCAGPAGTKSLVQKESPPCQDILSNLIKGVGWISSSPPLVAVERWDNGGVDVYAECDLSKPIAGRFSTVAIGLAGTWLGTKSAGSKTLFVGDSVAAEVADGVAIGLVK